ncbi:MAG: hypothetical protein HY039_07140 [Nitrospirae bacterium]|nr:hypothetical protein [Nitrospirota bacterium]
MNLSSVVPAKPVPARSIWICLGVFGALVILLGVWAKPGSASDESAICEIPLPAAGGYEARAALDACSLVTKDEATTYLRAGKGELSAQSHGGVGGESSTVITTCRYSSRTTPSRSLTISVQRYDSAADLERAFGGGDDPMFQKVSGFDGRAFWKPDAGMLELAAGRDHVVLSIRENGAPSLERAKSLMRKVLARL